jgi:hypothetical protein
MSNKPATNDHPEEIDLGYLVNKTGVFFKNLVKIFFLILAFFQKYIIITILLLIIGISYGLYKDSKGKKPFKNETIVIPNFESVDYLYGKVDALNSKISIRDTVFLRGVLDANYRKIRKIEIEPIVDIYNFISKSREHIDIFRILFQNQELSEFVEDMATSKYYKYHKLDFTIVGEENSEEIINDILLYLNSNEHFLEYQKVLRENTELEIAENTKMIAQVDSIFKAASSFPYTDKSNQSVYINDNSQLYNLLTAKRELLEDRTSLLMRQKDETDVIKLVSASYNLKPDGFVMSNAIKYPIYLILLFSLIFFIKYAYQKLKAIAESN